MSKFIVQLLLSFENEPIEDNNVLLFFYTRVWNQLKKGNMVAENRDLAVVELIFFRFPPCNGLLTPG